MANLAGGLKRSWEIGQFASGLNVTKESELGFRSGLPCASHSYAHRNILYSLTRGPIPA